MDELKSMYGEMLPSLSTASNTPMGSETGSPNKRPAVASSTQQTNASKKQGSQKGPKGRGKGRDKPQQTAACTYMCQVEVAAPGSITIGLRTQMQNYKIGRSLRA